MRKRRFSLRKLHFSPAVPLSLPAGRVSQDMQNNQRLFGFSIDLFAFYCIFTHFPIAKPGRMVYNPSRKQKTNLEGSIMKKFIATLLAAALTLTMCEIGRAHV